MKRDHERNCGEAGGVVVNIPTPEALGALESAANSGGRGVRRIARAQLAQFSKLEKSTT